MIRRSPSEKNHLVIIKTLLKTRLKLYFRQGCTFFTPIFYTPIFLHQFFIHQFFTPIFLHEFFTPIFYTIFLLFVAFCANFFLKNIFINFKIWCKNIGVKKYLLSTVSPTRGQKTSSNIICRTKFYKKCRSCILKKCRLFKYYAPNL